MPLLIRIGGILIAMIVVAALARHVLLPLLRSSGDAAPVRVTVTTPAEAQVTIDRARQDIEAAAKQAADRAAAADR